MSRSQTVVRVSCYLFVAAVWSVLLWAANELWKQFWERKARITHGCSAPKKLRNSGRLFGATKLRESAARIKEGSYLELTQRRFLSVGTSTYASKTFGKTIIDTSDPANIRTILATRFKDWELGEDRRWAFAPLLGTGIFAADAHHWRSSRATLRPSFNNAQLTQTEITEDRFQALLRIIRRQEGAFDLAELFGCFTMDCATKLFFGKSYNTLEMQHQHNTGLPMNSMANTSTNHFTAAFNRCQRVMADNLVLGKLGPLLMGAKKRKEFQEDCQIVNSFVREAMEHALADSGEPKSERRKSTFLYSLLANSEDQSDVSSALVNILVAGRDTTAGLLSNLWYVLARNPFIYQKLRAEVLSTLGPNPTSVPTYEDLQRMRILRACVFEALRLYPPVPLNSRKAICDTILPEGGGESGHEPLFIPKGTRVAYNVYAMHRREDIWGETAREFRPERWIESDGTLVQPGWEYLPFSGGPRVCIGQKLALTQVQFVTCRLVQHFQAIQAEADNVAKSTSTTSDDRNLTPDPSLVEAPASSWQWKENLTLTCTSAYGTWVSFR